MTSSPAPGAATPPGTVVWITGLPSSGKSSLAKNLELELRAGGFRALILDGDEVRAALVPQPGYSESERARFYEILANLAAAFARQGLVVLVPATAHRRSFREHARQIAPNFLEVWVDVSLSECRRRDKKGIYARFAAGELRQVPGEDLPFEPPESPDVIATGGKDTHAVATVAAKLAGLAQSA